MVQVVNKSQQVITRGMSPRAEYSRVVSVHVFLTDDDIHRWIWTPPLGNFLLLLGVDVWATPRAADPTARVEFDVRAGVGVPQTEFNFRVWDTVLPLYSAGMNLILWEMYDGENHKEWSMKKRYKWDAVRLGIIARRSMGMGDVNVWASFRISEG